MPEKDEIHYWFFNTNETNGLGAYQRMFARDVAAIWGYPSGPRKLMGAKAGDCILAYVNGQGLRAVGTIQDAKPIRGEGIFLNAKGEQQPNEFHLKVKWQVVAPRHAISNRMAIKEDCWLPVRCTFAIPSDKAKFKQLAERLRELAELDS